MAAQLTWTGSAVESLGWDSASATMFDIPSTCRRLSVYSEMKASCHCWRPEAGSETLRRAANNCFWSVHNWNCLPSSLEQKFLMPMKAARSSLSKVE
jgi:hypothetical protein